MSEEAMRDLRNVIVFALVDGKLTEEEKQFVQSLRAKLGVSAEEFERLCQEVREDPKSLALPSDPKEAETALHLLVEAATTDGAVSDPERRLLRRVAERVGLGESDLDDLIASVSGAHDEQLEEMVEEIYAGFAGWDEAVRRQKVEALAGLGRASVLPLLRVLESYRKPEGATDSLELKALAAEQLGKLGDERAVYYLAQQVNIGEMDDEVTNAALRSVAAEAIGRIVGEPITADREGVEAARQWWFAKGVRRYDRLAF